MRTNEGEEADVRDFGPGNAFTAAFKTELVQRAPVPIEFHETGLGGVPDR